MAYSADLCGSKLRGKLGAVLNESATTFSPALLSSDKSFAKRQLEKMGWTEGTGLGKRRDGMTEHVKVKQREEEMGLGREKMKAQEQADVWWKDSVSDTLARLQKNKSSKGDKEKKSKKKKKNDKKEKTKKKHFTDEELFAATGGARFGSTSGARANRSQHGKWKRSEEGQELTELEKKAKESMEWNGRGNARVVTSAESSSAMSGGNSDDCVKKDAKTPQHTETEDSDAKNKDVEKANKKKRKLEKKEAKRAKKAKKEKVNSDIHAVSPPASEEEKDVESSKRSKKSKKKKSKQ